jgi:hypothetical protein
MKIIILSMAAFMIAGCAIQRAQTAQDARVQMVGMSSEDILACMGPPENRDSEGNIEVWSYSSGGRTVGSGTSFGFGFGTGGYSGGVGVGVNNYSSTDLYCLVNVVMGEGRVREIRYLGPTGGALARDEQCSYAVEQCVR